MGRDRTPITLVFFIAAVAATLMRLELATPKGDLLRSDLYNRMFTLHGIVMVFFLVPSIPAVWRTSSCRGRRGDLAFPRINLFSWYLYIFGGLFALTAVLWGGVDTGWTFYTPYSSMYSNTNVLLGAMGVFIAGFSSILTGLNFIRDGQDLSTRDDLVRIPRCSSGADTRPSS